MLIFMRTEEVGSRIRAMYTDRLTGAVDWLNGAGCRYPSVITPDAMSRQLSPKSRIGFSSNCGFLGSYWHGRQRQLCQVSSLYPQGPVGEYLRPILTGEESA